MIPRAGFKGGGGLPLLIRALFLFLILIITIITLFTLNIAKLLQSLT